MPATATRARAWRACSVPPAATGSAAQSSGVDRFIGHYVDPQSNLITLLRAGHDNALGVCIVDRAGQHRAIQYALAGGGVLSFWNLTGTLAPDGSIGWSNSVVWRRRGGEASARGVSRALVAVLVVGLLRGFMQEATRRPLETFLDALGPRTVVNCFAVFQAQRQESNCSALPMARSVLSASNERVTRMRFVKKKELQEAYAGCDSRVRCPGYYLQFHKVWLAWRMLEQEEVKRGVRFNVVMRIRTDLTFEVDPSLISSLVTQATIARTKAHMQSDTAWLASRDVATLLANTWLTMIELGILQGSSGSSAQLAALRRVSWHRISSSCWAFASSFLKCLPYPSSWHNGWSTARTARLAVSTRDLEKALVNSTELWRVSSACPWIARSLGIKAAHELGYNSEPEVVLGLALFQKQPPRSVRHNASAGFSRLRHDECSGFGNVRQPHSNAADC